MSSFYVNDGLKLYLYFRCACHRVAQERVKITVLEDGHAARTDIEGGRAGQTGEHIVLHLGAELRRRGPGLKAL